jgi:hypothetical protein
VTPEEVLELVRGLVREESRRALEAALEWGLPKCRTQEERLLYPALLLLLGNLNALVTHRRLETGDLADFHLTASRAGPDAAPLRAHLVLRVAAALPAASAEGELWLVAASVHAHPLACAARVVEGLLARVSGRHAVSPGDLSSRPAGDEAGLPEA